MATAKSGTLVANATAINVTIDVEGFGSNAGYAVTNRSDSGVVWVRRDGSAATGPADNNHPVIGTRVFQNKEGSTTVTVSLWSDTACDYTVEAA